MNAPSARPAAWLLVILLLVAAPASVAAAKDKAGAGDDADDKAMADKDKPAKADAGDGDDDAAKGKSGEKSVKGGDKDAGAKLYLFKSQKKAKLNGAEVLSVVLQNAFTGKTETMFVPNSDPAGKAYDPLPDVATAVEGLHPGLPVEVEAERQKGKWMVTSLAKADVKPGEELPTGYVYVATDEKEDRGGNKTIVVTLSKFGREVKVAVPMWKNKEYKDANWEPDPKIDGELRRLQAGDVVEAKIKTGRPPTIVELYRFYPPERGKFVKAKEVLINGAMAFGFEMLSNDGTTVTITLPGTEQGKGEKKFLMPNPKQVAAVKRIKPDTEIEVLYREQGQTMFLRDIRFPKSAGASMEETGAGGDKGKMKPGATDDKADKGGAEDPKKEADEKKG